LADLIQMTSDPLFLDRTQKLLDRIQKLPKAGHLKHGPKLKP